MDNMDNKDNRDYRENRDYRDNRDNRNNRDNRESRKSLNRKLVLYQGHPHHCENDDNFGKQLWTVFLLGKRVLVYKKLRFIYLF